MPKKYSFQTLQKPNSKDVNWIPLAVSCFEVIRFSRLGDNESVQLHTEELKAYTETTILRRNEVLFEVGSTIDSKFVEAHS